MHDAAFQSPRHRLVEQGVDIGARDRADGAVLPGGQNVALERALVVVPRFLEALRNRQYKPPSFATVNTGAEGGGGTAAWISAAFFSAIGSRLS